MRPGRLSVCAFALLLALPLPTLAASGDDVVAFLDFYRRWDTAAQDHAGEVARQVVHQAKDYAAFRRVAPPGSENRRRFLEHLASFEDEARLVRERKVRPELMYEGWYSLPDSWIRVKPYIVGLRAETHDPHLCEGMEWLAGEADRYWKEQERHPPHWAPLDRAPTAGDLAVVEAFRRVWSTPRDTAAAAYFARVTREARTPQAFERVAPSASTGYTRMDRVMCAYDMAGELIKFGALNPDAFFAAWPSPARVWEQGGPWVRMVRAGSPSGGGYDSAEWLAKYEIAWRARHRAAGAR